MAERGLHKVRGRSAIESVRRMGMAQPVRRDVALDLRSHCGSRHDPVRLRRIESPALVREEHRSIGRQIAF
jgi:hypothetical protein